ncbi:hypothetical protein O3M35_006118 [Rhynocoris fuscipes]|uniref:Secreted ookinete protein n=1 Tax=Rhynocoris fuscipes TaxID=488301 RepID=A0AAW1DES2_9HEMI
MKPSVNFIGIFINYLFIFISIVNCGLILNKDENNNFYYNANSQNDPVDLDVGSEGAGIQEKMLFPRGINNEKPIESPVNGTDDQVWDQKADVNNDPVKRSIRPQKKSKKTDTKVIAKKEIENLESNNGNGQEYDYVDDNGVDNEDVYEDEHSIDNDERSELATARGPICIRNRHRFSSHEGKGSERNQHSADEYYEEYEDDSANTKTNRMGKSRNTRYDVMRR